MDKREEKKRSRIGTILVSVLLGITAALCILVIAQVLSKGYVSLADVYKRQPIYLYEATAENNAALVWGEKKAEQSITALVQNLSLIHIYQYLWKEEKYESALKSDEGRGMEQ